MNRHNLFWGAVLILVGAAFLGSNLGLFNLQWPIIWPLFFILLGVYILLSRSWPIDEQLREFNVPLEGAKQASLRLSHGAGKINLVGGGAAGDLLSGSGDTLSHKTRREGDELKVKLETSFDSLHSFFPWNWGQGHTWELKLNPQIPTSIKLESGASETHLDLRKTKVAELEVETGASSTTIIMPEQAGQTHAKISGGAAAFDITIPKGVAARIEVESGLASVNVDEKRFPRSGGLYQSGDYASANNKIDLKIEAGLSSVNID